jgi:REP element-mobilizing transposase RayT
MARRLRIEFPGAVYHVLSRGDRKELIFRDEKDRLRFIDTLGEACAKTGWKVHAFVLMPNHFHLVIETPSANLAAGMKWMLGTYTGRFNRRHGEVGHLFSGRYKALPVGGRGGYLRTVVDYVHLNPVRAKLMPSETGLRDFPWSSFPMYLATPKQRPSWLKVETVLGECAIPEDSPAGRRAFEQRLEARRLQESDGDFHPVRRGWFLGDEEFRQELLNQAGKRKGTYHFGPEIHEAEEVKAERLVAGAITLLGWSEERLRNGRKGAPEKVKLAERLRKETTMTLQWIAKRLHMGTKGHLSHLLYWERRGIKPEALSKKPRPKSARPGPPRESGPPKAASASKEQIQAPVRHVSASDEVKPLTDPNPFAIHFDTSFD